MKTAQESPSMTGKSRLLRRADIVVCMVLTATMFCCANLVSGQEKRLDAKLPESGLVLRDLPQPLRFFDVTGRKAGVFGRQNGQFEAWIYPVKLLHNFRLEF